ncbi:5-(carboxyamino)imidazole ribonucleotide synthase [Pontibacillus salicampi]|uniref:N5-carboxyaminoimidazole ribonucleotide synthase n=1 Tax=Pontibacillus salicampi TaxID=1449801 RepID=A0ABV6LMZ3_9BACI
MNKPILPGSTIGILGGGQLGKMMAIDAKQMGYRVVVLDPGEDGPCAQVADRHIQANLDDIPAAIQLAEEADVITYEFENVDLQLASELESRQKLPQGAYALQVTQDREKEKAVLTEAGVKVAPYHIVKTSEELQAAVTSLGYPCVMKTTRGGYDGKGQWKLISEEDFKQLNGQVEKSGPCIVESWLPFTMEISVVMTRGGDGDVKLFPIPENSHEDHILKRSIVPARINSEILKKAQQAAQAIAEHIQFLGTFTVELFVVDNEIYVNEMAPRPHNSGHYTIEACNVSQFGQHIRAICGLPLLEIDTPYAAVMTNILGEEAEEFYTNAAAFQQSHVHLYGKDAIKPKRKMGHVTRIANKLEEIL